MSTTGSRPALRVERTGPLTTVQDLGRPGLAHLGVPRSGAADRASLRLANRLVGNREGAAGLEVTLGGLLLTALSDVVLAVTGAQCPVRIGPVLIGRGEIGAAPAAGNAVLDLPAGAWVELGLARAGLRAYVAVRGGVQVDVVLGSRSTDTLCGIGPPALAAGDLLPIGAFDDPDVEAWPVLDVAPVAALPRVTDTVRLDAVLGPRADWLTATALDALWATEWTVDAQSDRVALRLAGPPLQRRSADELPSEGLVRGAVQVPPSGLPVLFLADHPVTGGYPVVAVIRDQHVDRAAQLRPGQRVLLRSAEVRRVPYITQSD